MMGFVLLHSTTNIQSNQLTGVYREYYIHMYILFFLIDGVVGEGGGLGQEHGRHSACHQGGVK